MRTKKPKNWASAHFDSLIRIAQNKATKKTRGTNSSLLLCISQTS